MSTLPAGCPESHNHLPSWEGEKPPDTSPPPWTIQSPPAPTVNLPLPSAPRGFPRSRVLVPITQEAGTRPHSGALLCAFAAVHTNSPAGFLLLWIQKRGPAPNGGACLGQESQVAHPSSALSTPKPSQGRKRKKEASYLSRVAFVWFAEKRRCP